MTGAPGVRYVSSSKRSQVRYSGQEDHAGRRQQPAVIASRYAVYARHSILCR